MMDVRKTVSEMYKYAKEEDSLLLSSFGAENEGYHFWDEYRLKHRKYDKLFNRMFNSFKYFMQEDGETIAEITENFTDDVYAHLMVNAKKYEELYRVNVIDDENYSITDNYNIVETLSKEITKEDSSVSGEREDSSADIFGSKNTVIEDAHGLKQTESTFDKSKQTDFHTNDVAGFNSINYSKDNITKDEYGVRTDSAVETVNDYTDTRDVNEGQQSNSSTFSKGEQTDSFSGLQTEDYSLTRKGNIGVRTITEVIEYHQKFWTSYEFYTMIFKDICAELLII